MGYAVEVVHEDGRRTRMSPTWLAKAGKEQGWRRADDTSAEPEPGRARKAKQDVPTTVEDEPSTSEEA